MKYRMLCVLLAVVITSGWLSGCSSDGDKTNEQPEQAANSQQSDRTGVGRETQSRWTFSIHTRPVSEK